MEQQYQQLQASHATLEQLVYALQHREAEEANAILAQVRQGIDVESVVRNITEGDLLLQLQVVPETKYRFTFPAGTEFPSYLQASGNAYLRSVMYETTLVPPNEAQRPASAPSGDHLQPEYFKPYVAAKTADPRLDKLKPSMWTNVSNDDGLLKTLIRHYFHYEYQWLCCFHKDHFLDDMLSGSTRYCSSLLVNSVLALACGCYHAIEDRLEYWNPESLGYRFLAEAKRLWELEQGAKSSLTTIQAALVINVILNMQSMDKLGMTYTVQALNMAHKLGLFGPLTHLRSKRRQDSFALTAWNIYFWLSLSAYHFMVPPLVREPPATALPDPMRSAKFYPELWVQYPLNERLRPMNHGLLFKAKMDFMLIINRFSAKVFERKGTQYDEPSTELLREHIIQLQHWYSSLPIPLSSTMIVYPTQLKLHLLYHNVIVNFCQLLVARPEKDTILIGRDTPQQMLEHSKACFETLLRLYFLRHGFEGSDTYVTHSLMTLAFAAIGEQKALSEARGNAPNIRREELRHTIILAAKGLRDQGQNYYVSVDVFNVVRGAMDPADEDALNRFVRPDRNWQQWNQMRSKHVRAQWPLNIVRITDHPDDQRLGALIKQYSDLSMEAHSSGAESDASASS
ncbi:MAG: hypothetical protein M1822_004047 [Bathelium mastoideum]|nr:MAG: hypothetical protein M1822_004047 [Bathelium mastoideum]